MPFAKNHFFNPLNRPKNAEGKFRSEFPEHTETALKFARERRVDKQQVVSIHRGFYLILSPQFRSKRFLPPSMFLDELMQDLKRDCYLALLNVAAVYGFRQGLAAHSPTAPEIGYGPSKLLGEGYFAQLAAAGTCSASFAPDRAQSPAKSGIAGF